MSCAESLSNPPPIQENPCTLVFVVAAALIDNAGHILLTQRPPGKKMAGYWEFPGGKVDEGEQPEFALMRELREELGIETRPTCFQPLTFASHRYHDFHLIMPLYACRMWDGIPQGKEGQNLAWSKPQDLGNHNLLPADIPLIPILQSLL